MHVLRSLAPLFALVAAGAQAASSWGFSDATLSLHSKTQGDFKEALSAKAPLDKKITLGPKDTIKVAFTAQENGKAKRPHQAFLVLRETKSDLEVPFPLTIKDSGKAVVEITQKDLPIQHAIASEPLSAHVVIGSFGSSQPLQASLFDLVVERDANDLSAQNYEPPLRYGQKQEIFHTYKQSAKNPPVVVSLFFVAAVLVPIPALLIGWFALGANLNHAAKAFQSAPISHAVFLGSILAMQGVFAGYYLSWKLIPTLPVFALVGVVAFLSGSKALGEVQGRRLAGER